jgi:aspartate 1-decarboxylase
MLITLLKSKIYRAIVTKASLEYSGSLGIDEAFMKKAGIIPYEKLLVVNMNTGQRFETYCIQEKKGSKHFALYGGAARLGISGDPLIIMTFGEFTPQEAAKHKPTVLNL